MVKIFLIITAFLTVSLKAQFENEPHAIFKVANQKEKIKYKINPDNPVFTNINLTNQVYPQNEPTVRISRTNPNIVVAAWRDFRLGYTGNIVRRIGYSYSTNGGLTWSVSELLPDPNLNGYVSQSDPVLASDASGNFYLSSTSRKSNNYPQNRDQIVYKSTNNGQTFFFLSAAMISAGGGGEDKEWMWCDLVPGNSTYNNLLMTSTNTVNGLIRFAKSTNGGVNWTTPVNFSDVSGTGSNICSGTNNQIYVVWQHGSGGVRFDKSTNGGASFGTDYALSTVTSTNGFPFICVDYSSRATRGNVYVVWDDMRGGNSDVYFQKSTNAGVNWLTTPVRINDVTTGNQYWPAIQCDTNGNIYVIYYDERLGTSQVNSYVAYSTDAGNTWINFRLSNVSFPLITVNSDVRIGDYIGIDAYNYKVLPVWTDDRAGTPDQEIYTSPVGPLVAAENPNLNHPREYALKQNYPNPFNPYTIIEYSLQKTGYYKIIVYDVLGKEVSVIADGFSKSGNYAVKFDASNLNSGVYFYTLITNGFTDTKKMTVIK